jgi:AmmeMemoRadiSam system protein B
MARIRRAAVAGRFYPASPAELRGTLAALLADARGEAAESAGGARTPKALIAPHAGYVFSGPVAASAYVRLASARDVVKRVVLLGPAHYAYVRGLALPECDAFATPLGEVPLDRAATSTWAALPFVDVDERAHAREHCLEVQLPFLQHVLAEFTIVPAVVGDASAEEVAAALDAVWGGPETLIVISSDLSHYHDHATARRLDAATAHAIERLAPAELDEESACGRVPIAGLLLAAARRKLSSRVLDLRNSGDTAGGRDAVVGYGAWAFA